MTVMPECFKKKLGFFRKQKLEKAVNQEIQNIFLSVELLNETR